MKTASEMASWIAKAIENNSPETAAIIIMEEYNCNPYASNPSPVEYPEAIIANFQPPSPMSAEQVEDISKTIFASIDHYREAGRDDEFNIKSIAEYLQRHFATTPSVKAEGWVSVEDGLPEDGEDVLCISKSINCPVLANYNNSAFEVKKYPCPSDRVLIAYWEDVTHWQPLPNPPKQQ